MESPLYSYHSLTEHFISFFFLHNFYQSTDLTVDLQTGPWPESLRSVGFQIALIDTMLSVQ